MSAELAERLGHALLFEGYVLYPYRRSSLKNQQRWAFGSLYPPGFCARGEGDASALRIECLVQGAAPRVALTVRFLQFVARRDESEGSGSLTLPWQEAIERRFSTEPRGMEEISQCSELIELAYPGRVDASQGVQRIEEPLGARVRMAAAKLERECWKVSVSIENVGSVPEDCTRHAALARALVSTHAILHCQAGAFVSLLEPPAELLAAARACKQEGAFPVLVGAPGDRSTLLASPIILYDYPAVAPESPGDLFDATEIDEILTLRILTMTEAEKREAARTDPRVRALLERTEAGAEAQLWQLHGTFREPSFPDRSIPESQSNMLAPGDRVRLRPSPGGDILDLALAGEVATIASVEQDLEGRVHYSVTIDADPGRDLGVHGQPGHRFFFAAHELERLP